MADEEDIVETRKRIKQLENQNIKLKKLLSTAIDVVNDDVVGIDRLKEEAEALTEIVDDLENEKVALHQELQLVKYRPSMSVTKGMQHLEDEHTQLRAKLDDVLRVISRDHLVMQELRSEDQRLQRKLADLEAEKLMLVRKIALIEERKDNLSKEGDMLKERLSHVESLHDSLAKCRQIIDSRSQTSREAIVSNFRYIEETYKEYIDALEEHQVTGENLEEELLSLTDTEQQSEVEINKKIIISNTNLMNRINEVKSRLHTSLSTNHNQMTPLAETDELEQDKDTLYQQLEKSLEQSSKEVGDLMNQLTNSEIKKLVHEIEIQKTVLLYNLKMMKFKDHLKQVTPPPSLPSPLSEEVMRTVSQLETTETIFLDVEDSQQIYYNVEKNPSEINESCSQHKLQDGVDPQEVKGDDPDEQLQSVSAEMSQQQALRELQSIFMKEGVPKKLKNSTIALKY